MEEKGREDADGTGAMRRERALGRGIMYVNARCKVWYFLPGAGARCSDHQQFSPQPVVAMQEVLGVLESGSRSRNR